MARRLMKTCDVVMSEHTRCSAAQEESRNFAMRPHYKWLLSTPFQVFVTWPTTPACR